MTGAMVVQIVAVALALVLALRGLRARRLSGRSIGWQAAAWIGIIVVVTLVIGALNGHQGA